MMEDLKDRVDTYKRTCQVCGGTGKVNFLTQHTGIGFLEIAIAFSIFGSIIGVFSSWLYNHITIVWR